MTEGGKTMQKKRRREGEVEFRILMAVTWPVFFASTLIRRAMPWNWGRDKRSIFEASRASAYNTIPFAFM
jgi:hypothetical protein